MGVRLGGLDNEKNRRTDADIIAVAREARHTRYHRRRHIMVLCVMNAEGTVRRSFYALGVRACSVLAAE